MLEKFHPQPGTSFMSSCDAPDLTPDSFGVVLLGHGSRRAEANLEWEQIWDMFRKLHPQLMVQRGYVEFSHPTLEEGVALLLEQRSLHTILIVPLFLTTGKHLYQHIPEKIAHLEESYPKVSFILTEHIGPDHLLLKIIEQRIAQSVVLR